MYEFSAASHVAPPPGSIVRPDGLASGEHAPTATDLTSWRRHFGGRLSCAAASATVLASIPLVFGAPLPQVHIRVA